MSNLKLFLTVVLFAENIALILAHIVDKQVTDRDGFGEQATHAMRKKRTDVVVVRPHNARPWHWPQ